MAIKYYVLRSILVGIHSSAVIVTSNVDWLRDILVSSVNSPFQKNAIVIVKRNQRIKRKQLLYTPFVSKNDP